MGGLVFGGLMLFRERLDYAGAANYANEILKTEDDLLSALNGEGNGFEDSISRVSEYFTSLGASSAMKNEDVKMRYDELSGMVEKFTEMQSIVGWLTDFETAIATNGYVVAMDEMGDSAPNKFLTEMVEDIMLYVDEVAAFKEKYADGASDYSAMTEEYGLTMLSGSELEEKYAEIELAEIAGVSISEIQAWYGDLRNLWELLENKK